MRYTEQQKRNVRALLVDPQHIKLNQAEIGKLANVASKTVSNIQLDMLNRGEMPDEYRRARGMVPGGSKTKATVAIAPTSQLNNQEICEVRNLVLDGESVESIAKDLNLSPHVVRMQHAFVSAELKEGSINRNTQYQVDNGVITRRANALHRVSSDLLSKKTPQPSAVAVARPAPVESNDFIAKYKAAKKAQMLQQLAQADAEVLEEILYEIQSN